jgi:hypothetical protein
MGFPSRSTNLGTMLSIGHGSMGRKICTAWITRWLCDHHGLFIYLDVGYLGSFMMSPFYMSQICTKANANFLCILMSTLSTY